MKEKQENVIGFLFRFAGRDKNRMIQGIIFAVSGEFAGTLPYLSAAILAGRAYSGTLTVPVALMWTGTAATGIVSKALLSAMGAVQSHRAAFTMTRNIRRAILDKMQRVPLGMILDTPAGTLKTIAVDNADKFEDAAAKLIPELPSRLASPLVYAAFLFTFDWRMGLGALVTLPPAILFYLLMLSGYHRKMELYVRSRNEMNASLVEYISGIQVIKAFGRTGEAFGKFARSVHFFHNTTMAWWNQAWLWTAAFKAVLPSVLLGTLPVGAFLFMNGDISMFMLIASLVFSLGFIEPFMAISQSMGTYSMAAADMAPVKDFLSAPEQVRPENPVILDGSAFVFERVDFAYHGDKKVLHQVSFETVPGSMTAIVGPSGSGKSTIAKLMAGFWDVTGGVVRYGGRDVRQIPFEQLMGEVSFVAQDNYLFDRSIRENIRMGKPDATGAEVEAAARLACCHDFIMGLPRGYGTSAGEAGDRLSGGERQRITLARAMLKPASVIILDEATAYADPESEASIQEAVGRLVQGKTLIVVAHRLATIQNARQILVVDKGRIAAGGSQAELLKTCPLYKKMWQQHTGGGR